MQNLHCKGGAQVAIQQQQQQQQYFIQAEGFNKG